MCAIFSNFLILAFNALIALESRPHGVPFKGEIQNRFNLISEERVNISEQNSENLMKIG